MMKNFTIREKIGIGIISFGSIIWLVNISDRMILGQASDVVLIGIFFVVAGYLRRTLFKGKKKDT